MIWNTLNQSCFQNFPNLFNEQESLPILLEDQIIHTNFSNIHINTDINCQLELLPNITTRAILANRPSHHGSVEIRSNQSTVNG